MALITGQAEPMSMHMLATKLGRGFLFDVLRELPSLRRYDADAYAEQLRCPGLGA